LGPPPRFICPSLCTALLYVHTVFIFKIRTIFQIGIAVFNTLIKIEIKVIDIIIPVLEAGIITPVDLLSRRTASGKNQNHRQDHQHSQPPA